MIKVLVTSVGATGAQNVLKALREQKKYPVMLFGTDSSPLNAGKYMADEFSVVPDGENPGFADQLLSLLKKWKINILIPIMESEIEKIASRPGPFRPYWPVVSGAEAVLDCRDKIRTASRLKELKVKSPVIFEPGAEIVYPVIVKPRKGCGSLDTVKVCRAEDLNAHRRQDSIIQEFVEGTEYTVDAFCTLSGRLIGVVPRRRLAIKGGLATKTVTVEHPELCSITARIVQEFELRGPSNIQFIETNEGALHCIDINPRFGGAYIGSIAAGLNAPLFLLDEFSGNDIQYGGYKRGLLMLRYWQETFDEAGVGAD